MFLLWHLPGCACRRGICQKCWEASIPPYYRLNYSSVAASWSCGQTLIDLVTHSFRFSTNIPSLKDLPRLQAFYLRSNETPISSAAGTFVVPVITVRKLADWASTSARSVMPSLRSSRWSLRTTPIIQTTSTAATVGESAPFHLGVKLSTEHSHNSNISWHHLIEFFSMVRLFFFPHRKELTVDARELKGELYCLPCHDKMGVPICGACRRPIEGRVVNAMGKQWHVEVCSFSLTLK